MYIYFLCVYLFLLERHLSLSSFSLFRQYLWYFLKYILGTWWEIPFLHFSALFSWIACLVWWLQMLLQSVCFSVSSISFQITLKDLCLQLHEILPARHLLSELYDGSYFYSTHPWTDIICNSHHLSSFVWLVDILLFYQRHSLCFDWIQDPLRHILFSFSYFSHVIFGHI